MLAGVDDIVLAGVDADVSLSEKDVIEAMRCCGLQGIDEVVLCLEESVWMGSHQWNY